jgi:DNA recombination protein RmuC
MITWAFVVACGLLLVLLYRHQKALIRCASLEEQVKSQADLQETFERLSSQVLEKTNQSFLSLAGSDLAQRQHAVGEMIGRIENNLRQIEQERKVDHGALRQQISTLSEAEHLLRTETGNLAKALRSPASRGRWGEIQLRRVVELAGMVNHCDFFEQSEERGEEGKLRPDLVVRLPGERQVVIDAKVSLDAYLAALEAPNELERESRLREHARQVRAHMVALGKKSYWEKFTPTPEFVVLFMPSETVFGAALEYDPSLIEMGAKDQVILATPTTLIALLRAVAYGWRQEILSIHVAQVQELGQELYKRLADMDDHWKRVGRALGSAVEAYNKTTASLESRVLVSARRFQELGAAPATLTIPITELVDRQPRLTE